MTAREQTDLEIAELERKIKKIYKRAAKEAKKKAQDYFDKFKKWEYETLQKVKAGKITPEQYEYERTRKLLLGQGWKNRVESINSDLRNTMQSAADLVNGRLPRIYAVNFNEPIAEIEQFGLRANAYLVNEETVNMLVTRNPSLLPFIEIDGEELERWNREKINSEVLQGIIQGESIDRLADRFERFVEMNRTSAIRNARTTATSAENLGKLKGMERAESLGLIVKKQWIAILDKRVRHDHEALNGQERDLDEPFIVPEADEANPSKPPKYPGEKINYPGDFTANPGLVYNCRCAMKSHIIGRREIK